MNTPFPPGSSPAVPPAEELALIDRELIQLDARRHYLLSRRNWLIGVLTHPGPASAGPVRPTAGPAGPAGPGAAPARGAQNVLLTLGAVLLAVAALAFTLVSWGSLGIAGRSVVLALVTGAALAAPVALLRRGLRSTAESVAAVGLLLTVLDAYALHAAGLPGVDGTAYAAGASAVLAALWAGYGATLPRLRLPLLAAVLVAQLPLPLAAAAAGARPLGAGWAVLVTAALDAALAVTVARRSVRVTAWVTASVAGALALLTASVLSLTDPGSVGPALLLAAGAALGVAVAWREARASAAALVGALAAVAAVGALVPAGHAARGDMWPVVVHLVAALPLLAAVRASALPAQVRRGLLWAGAGVAAVAALTTVPTVGLVLSARGGVLGEVWASTTPSGGGHGAGSAVPVALLLVAGAGWWAARELPRREPAVVAVVAGWAGLFTAPVLLGLPVAAVLGAQTLVTAAAGALALRASGRAVARAGAVCAAAGALNVSLGALDGRVATFAVFGLLGAGAALGAAYGPARLPVRAGGAVLAVGYGAAVAVAAAAVAGLAPAWLGVAALAAPAAVVALAPRLGAVRVPAECAAAAAGAVAVVLAAGDPPVLALVLALGGVLCAGAALRVDRRRLGWVAMALFVAATWVRLGASGVTVPEAYALPVSVPALAVGFLSRRKDPAVSSWTAYGPGLGATLLPSLVAAWGEAHWPRPLLLGLAALALTLAGAHRRLAAPLLLGGVTLAAVALHELAPYVVQVAGALPRWLPPALAGLLLLMVGATYEKRLRDARRLRGALGRLR
ncbi:SCO7613 C-terminal domain-containing membrane protein [Streptomyces sp. NPDC090054]|uniref:SCO7613 C-terminal domain-containing membrane protein n=1 Tax=Streptomyces sp. NPDC090054 TaxID=3365933 RepID=UPI00380A9974